MDSLDRRLIELNEALLSLSEGKPIRDGIIQQARQSLAGHYPIDTGAGNDVVIINNPKEDCNTCPPGPQGEKGDKGDPGDCNCCAEILISNDYTATSNDYYIGVNSDKAVTITLPEDPEDCLQLIIKAEMGPPLGNRKVTITTSDESTIDGAEDYVIEVPYGVLKVISRGGEWYII